MLTAATALGSSIVLVCALAACAALRRRSAAVRHIVLAAGVFPAACVAPVSLVLPASNVSLSPPATAPAAEQFSGGPSGGNRVQQSTSASRGGDVRVVAAVVLGWGIGLGMLVVGVCRIARMTRAAPRVTGALAQISHQLSEAYGLRRPVVLLRTRTLHILATWGISVRASCSRRTRAMGRAARPCRARLTSWRTSGATTGSFRRRPKSSAPPSGSTRCSGSPAVACAAKASRRATTPCCAVGRAASATTQPSWSRRRSCRRHGAARGRGHADGSPVNARKENLRHAESTSRSPAAFAPGTSPSRRRAARLAPPHRQPSASPRRPAALSGSCLRPARRRVTRGRADARGRAAEQVAGDERLQRPLRVPAGRSRQYVLEVVAGRIPAVAPGFELNGRATGTAPSRCRSAPCRRRSPSACRAASRGPDQTPVHELCSGSAATSARLKRPSTSSRCIRRDARCRTARERTD